MPAFFSSNNKILNAFGRIADVVYLSFIWLLFSIPLITIGASTTALYYTVNKVIRNQRGHVLREFWKSFRSGFLQSTILWLGFLALLFFLRADLKALEYLGYDNKILLYIVQGVAIFATLVLVYALCYVARFTQKLGALLLFTLVMLFSNLPQTLLLLLVCAPGGVDGLYLPAFADHHARRFRAARKYRFGESFCEVYDAGGSGYGRKAQQAGRRLKRRPPCQKMTEEGICNPFGAFKGSPIFGTITNGMLLR